MKKPKPSRGAERTDDALSRERIVLTAIELLDEDGDSGLTFRALAARLQTGPGAIYWHVSNKSELLIAAADVIIARSLSEATAADTATAAIRGIAVVVYDAIDARPWVGTQLSRTPWETPMLRIFERIGHHIPALGGRGDRQFTFASAISSYIIGVGLQNAANAVRFDPAMKRDDFLEQVLAQWRALDAREFPFIRNVVAPQLPHHDDREEFIAGLDLILSGIAHDGARRRPKSKP